MAGEKFNQKTRKSKDAGIMNCGVYRIVNTRTGDFYIGSAVDIKKRLKEHLKHLKNGKHNSKFQAAYNIEPNSNVFLKEVILVCSEENLELYEQSAIDSLNPAYNVYKTVTRTHLDSEFGRKVSQALTDLWLEADGDYYEYRREAIRNGMAKMSKEDFDTMVKNNKASLTEFWSNQTEDYKTKHGEIIRVAHSKRTPEQRLEESRLKSEKCRGELSGSASITEETAKLIREATGTLREIFERFGTTRGVVYSIKKGTSWKHLTNTLVPATRVRSKYNRKSKGNKNG